MVCISARVRGCGVIIIKHREQNEFNEHTQRGQWCRVCMFYVGKVCVFRLCVGSCTGTRCDTEFLEMLRGCVLLQVNWF